MARGKYSDMASQYAYMMRMLSIKAQKRLVFGVCVSILGGVSTFLAEVILIKLIINGLYHQTKLSTLFGWILLIFAISVFTGALMYFFSLYRQKVNAEISTMVAEKLMKKVRDINLKKYENSEFYDEYNRVLEKGDKVFIQGLNALNSLISSVVIVVGIMTYLFRLSALVIVVCILASAATYYLNQKIIKNNYKMFTETSTDNRRLQYIDRIYYLKDYSKEMRLFNLSPMLRDKYNRVFEQRINKQKEYYRTNSSLSVVSSFLPYLVTYLFITLYTIYKITRRLLQIGDFVSINNASFQLINRFNLMINRVNELYEVSLYIGNFKNFMERDFTLPQGEALVEPQLDVCLEFHEVSFAYEEGHEVLHKISFKLEQGEKVAVVGLNGAGKTTFIKLLMRLYDPEAGRITYQGKDIREYQIDSYFSLFGTVFQDFKEYSFSVKENLYFLKAGETEDSSTADILEKVGLKHKMKEHRDFLHTEVGNEFQNGVNFSGGELQKLAIARSIAKDGKIMIFDEASSALDPLSEYEVNQLLLNSFQDKSIVMISHRLSTVVHADRIYFFEKGRIIEEGSHQQLMEQQGRYCRLFQLQASQYGK